MKLIDILNKTTRFMQDESFTTNSRNEFVDAINKVQMDLDEMLKIHYNLYEFTTVKDTQKYLMPEDFIEFVQNQRAVVVNDGTTDRNIWLASYDYLTQLDDFRTRKDKPTYFFIEDKFIGFYPTPAEDGAENNAKIEYITYSTELINDGDECSYSNKYLYVLAYLASALIYQQNDRYQDSAYYKNEGLKRLNEIANTTHFQDNEGKTTEFNYLGSGGYGRASSNY